jgi:two-component system, chemotaxis family, chemotaxis protein CheY
VNFLIVEDEPIARIALEILLHQYGETQTAEDGREAIATFKEATSKNVRFDAIFLDIMMPHADGHEVLETIRSIEQKANIQGTNCTKIIMCSALGDSKNIIKAFRNQCEGYITKPIFKEELAKKLKELDLLEQ